MNSNGCVNNVLERVIRCRPAIVAFSLALGTGITATELAAQEINGGRLMVAKQSLWVGLVYSVIATAVLLVAIWLVRRIRTWGLGKLQRMAVLPGGLPTGLATNLRPHILQAGQVLTRVAAALLMGFLTYLWLVYAFKQFTYTASWGDRLGQFLLNLVLDFGGGALRAIPGLFTVVVIILIARWGVRLINALFNEVEAGKRSAPWLERETVRTTQTLLIVVLWLFALVVAYP
jgi:hypothetical protein